MDASIHLHDQQLHARTSSDSHQRNIRNVDGPSRAASTRPPTAASSPTHPLKKGFNPSTRTTGIILLVSILGIGALVAVIDNDEGGGSDIAESLRQIVASLTTGETMQLQVAVDDLDSACASHGA